MDEVQQIGTVLIIGAGCTGLALAHGLKQAGIPCAVFDQKESLLAGGRDWNMGLHWGVPVLKSLLPFTIFDTIQSWQVDPHVPTKDEDVLRFVKGDTGDLMAAIPVKNFYRIRRQRLREVMVKDLNVSFNKKLEAITFSKPGDPGPAVTARFADGTIDTGSIVIGTDGAKSTVRRILLGEEVAAVDRVPYAATFVYSRYPREQALFLRKFHPLYICSPHPRSKFAFFGMHDVEDPLAPETWTMFMYISWPWTVQQQHDSKTWSNKQKLEQVQELAEDFADPFKSAAEWLSGDTTVWHVGMTEWDPSLEGHTWDNHSGRVTLAGDAAHPMTYQRGQGLNHSLTDAARIRDVLLGVAQSAPDERAVQLAGSIDSYEDEMKKRGGEEVKLSLKQSMMLHDWNLVRESPVFRAGLAQSGS